MQNIAIVKSRQISTCKSKSAKTDSAEEDTRALDRVSSFEGRVIEFFPGKYVWRTRQGSNLRPTA